MPERREKMMCPDCGVGMNYHADKIDYSAALEDASGLDAVFGGVVEEAHTCPVCGRTHMRRTDDAHEKER
jgi:ribosomal protein S27AE